MNITPYHSSSAGNLYRVDDLLLEAGVSIHRIKKCLHYRLSEIRACLITHDHGDHATAVKGLLKAGVDCYMSQGTADALGVSGHRLHILEAGKQTRIDEWRVMPFATIHDAAEPLGFLIAKNEEKLLFLTDTHYSPWRFRGLTHVMVEAGYDPGILQNNISAGLIHPAVARRTLHNHMSIDTALGLLRANDLSAVQEVYLLHLSAANSDADQFKGRVQQLTGRETYVAPE